MPTFDIVSNIDSHELSNAVDQANREIQTRFDFKGVKAEFELSKEHILMRAEADFQLNQMTDILKTKFAKRELDVRSLEFETPELALNEARQRIVVKQGIETTIAKRIVKLLKQGKLKVQASIQGEQVRVTGKKRDDLQAAIALIKKEEQSLPLQFENFRD